MCDTWQGMFHSRPPMCRLPSLPRVVEPGLAHELGEDPPRRARRGRGRSRGRGSRARASRPSSPRRSGSAMPDGDRLLAAAGVVAAGQLALAVQVERPLLDRRGSASSSSRDRARGRRRSRPTADRGQLRSCGRECSWDGQRAPRFRAGTAMGPGHARLIGQTGRSPESSAGNKGRADTTKRSIPPRSGMGCQLNPNSTWPTTQAMQPSPAPSAAALAEGPRPADAALQNVGCLPARKRASASPAEPPPGSIPLPPDDLAHSQPRLGSGSRGSGSSRNTSMIAVTLTRDNAN